MISVVVCTYSRAESLGRMLDSLRQMRVPPELEWELIVVDNNSTDNTRAVVEEFAQTSSLDVHYVFEPKQGLSNARNTGIANARGEIIAFTDDDVRVSPEWLAEIVRTFKEFDCMGVGGKSIPMWDGAEKPAWLVTTGPYRLPGAVLLDLDLGDDPRPVPFPPFGVNMAFKRSAFERYGLFRTDLGVCGAARLGGEDIEFGRRLLGGGEKVIYSPGAVVFHPVDKGRVSKAYFLHWYFNCGTAWVRMEGTPREAVLWFGVPRYMFRGLLENCVKWLAAFDNDRRFFYKMRSYFVLGQIAGCRKLGREGTLAP